MPRACSPSIACQWRRWWGWESRGTSSSRSAPTRSRSTTPPTCRIVVPNQKEKMEWRVQGAVLAAGHVHVFDASPEAPVGSRPTSTASRTRPRRQPDDDMPSKQTYPQAAAERKEPVQHQLMVGNCGATAGAGDFSFDNAAAAAGARLPGRARHRQGGSRQSKDTRHHNLHAPRRAGRSRCGMRFRLTGSPCGAGHASRGGGVRSRVEVRLRGFCPRCSCNRTPVAPVSVSVTVSSASGAQLSFSSVFLCTL